MTKDEEKAFVLKELELIRKEAKDNEDAVGKGWHPLLKVLFGDVEHFWIACGIRIEVVQVKEKFGGLRFYYDTHFDSDMHPSLYDGEKCIGWRRIGDSELLECGSYSPTANIDDSVEKILHRNLQQFEGAVEFAESISYHICEECGKPGHRRAGSWIKTLCDDCDRVGKEDPA